MKPDAEATRERILEALLRGRLSWSGLHRREIPSGGGQRDAVVPTDRLIYLEAGELAYQIEGQEHCFRQGMLWLVPAWTRRSWQAEGGAQICWVEFSLLPQWMSLPVVMTEEPTLEAVFAEEGLLLQEVGLKHLLMRMVAGGRWQSAPQAGEFDVAALAEIMRERLHEADLLARLPALAGMTAQQLRARFRKALRTAPGHYLEALRMQRARYLLLTTQRSIKEVAFETGFEDPLYFSRRYRRFWSEAPKAHRGGVGYPKLRLDDGGDKVANA